MFVESSQKESRQQKAGAPKYTYGRGIYKAMKKANIDINSWQQVVKDRTVWRNIIRNLDI